MADDFKVAVVGAGLAGRRHAHAARSVSGIELTALVDPSEEARAFADSLDAPWCPDIQVLLRRFSPHGVVIATPNHLHLEHGLTCIEAGIPVLVEKPIAVDVVSAHKLVVAAEAAGVGLLVGHHRRYNPVIAAARDLIDDGAIGRITAIHASCWLFKPEEYFETSWRRRPGAGPVYINLIHDIDVLRHLCGEIISVVGQESNTSRGFDVEDTAAILLQFENGALGTLTVSDTIVGPWSWEMTASENPVYPATNQACYFIGGTRGSLELPKLKVWHQPKRGWWEPMEHRAIDVVQSDPITEQMARFREVAQGKTAPLVSGREGLKSLAVIEAIKKSASTVPPRSEPVSGTAWRTSRS